MAYNSKEELEGAVTASGLFRGVSAGQGNADIILRVERTSGGRLSRWIYLNAAFLCLLPLPAEKSVTVYQGWLRVGDYPEVQLPPVRETSKSWVGLPLLPFSFIQYSQRGSLERMSGDVVAHMAREYATLHESSWRAAQANASADELERFLAGFPGSMHAGWAKDTLERSLFARLQSSPSADDYLRYLRNFPGSERAPAVRSSGAESTWEELAASSDEQRLEEYLQCFEDSPHWDEAAATLEGVMWDNLHRGRLDLAAYRALLQRFPAGVHAQDCRDVLDWGHAEQQRTPQAVTAYLAQHPKGRYRSNALVAKARLEDHRLLEIAKGLPSLVEASIRSSVSRFPGERAQVSRGTIMSNQGGSLLNFSYEVEYDGRRLASYSILGGSVRLDGEDFALGADGRWYPAFPHVLIHPQ